MIHSGTRNHFIRGENARRGLFTQKLGVRLAVMQFGPCLARLGVERRLKDSEKFFELFFFGLISIGQLASPRFGEISLAR